MEKTYVVALVESLEKKVKVLDDIIEKNKEQEAVLKEEPFSFDRFDKTVEDKGVLIFKLNKLDEGFESLYEKVKAELDNNKPKYAREITAMQSLIREITDKSTLIQADEQRNKQALERIFKDEKKKIKAQRSTANAVNSYTRAMKYNDLK